MVTRLATLVLWLLAAMTTLLGLRWVLEPRQAAASLGMPLLDGLGRSTQIGESGALFFGIAAMLLLGVQTGRESWLHAAAIFVALAALMRTLAWALHDAPLAGTLIGLELLLAVLILAACKLRAAG